MQPFILEHFFPIPEQYYPIENVWIRVFMLMFILVPKIVNDHLVCGRRCFTSNWDHFVAKGECIFLAFLSWRFGHIINKANEILPSHVLIAEVKFLSLLLMI